jgi:hypothetical protein
MDEDDIPPIEDDDPEPDLNPAPVESEGEDDDPDIDGMTGLPPESLEADPDDDRGGDV